IQLTVPENPSKFGTTKVSSEPSGFITKMPPALKLAIYSLSGETLAYKLEDRIFVNRVISPPLTGTDHQSEGVPPFALATRIPTNFSNQFGWYVCGGTGIAPLNSMDCPSGEKRGA